ncbi:hypothetical protein RCL1_001066 [Eukaryota sp. TZLM3-RCL]
MADFSIVRVTYKLHQWHITLSAEVSEIEKDMRLVSQLADKYNSDDLGASLTKLQKRLDTRLASLRRIENIINLHSLHIDSGKSLLNKLSSEFKNITVQGLPAQEDSLSCSKILSNSFFSITPE